MQMKIPDDVSFGEAAAIGVGTITAGQHLYQALGLPQPRSPALEPFSILIYGGSTATGTIAIQLAKLYVKLGTNRDKSRRTNIYHAVPD